MKAFTCFVLILAMVAFVAASSQTKSTHVFAESNPGEYKFCVPLGKAPNGNIKSLTVRFPTSFVGEKKLAFDAEPRTKYDIAVSGSDNILVLVKDGVAQNGWNIETNEIVKDGALSGYIYNDSPIEFITVTMEADSFVKMDKSKEVCRSFVGKEIEDHKDKPSKTSDKKRAIVRVSLMAGCVVAIVGGTIAFVGAVFATIRHIRAKRAAAAEAALANMELGPVEDADLAQAIQNSLADRPAAQVFVPASDAPAPIAPAGYVPMFQPQFIYYNPQAHQ